MKYLTYALVLLLGACSTAKVAYYEAIDTIEDLSDSDKNIIGYNKCPSVFVAEDLSFLHDYSQSSTHQPKNLRSTVSLSKQNVSCQFEEQTVIVDAQFDFNGILGPKGRLLKSDAPLYSYPFFVAITDRGGAIMTKQIFAATMPYPSGSDEGYYKENIRQVIPVSSPKRAKFFAVIAGFQLSDEQLAENREFLEVEKHRLEEEARLQKTLEAQASHVSVMDLAPEPDEKQEDNSAAEEPIKQDETHLDIATPSTRHYNQ